MKKFAIITFNLFLFLSCVRQESKNNIGGQNYEYIDSLNVSELNDLRGIEIFIRANASSPTKFVYNDSVQLYTLPIFDSVNSTADILNSNFYDVLKYARSKNADSANALEYVKSYSDRILGIFKKTKAIEIFSRHSYGDFIIFQYTDRNFIYLFPWGIIRNSSWQERITTAYVSFKPNWYR